MQTHLDSLLAPGALTAVFQPVFDTRPQPAAIFAYEGLVRGPAHSNFEHPDVMFGYVRHKRGEEQIDRACVAAILGAATSLPPEARISINVHAATLGRHRNFADYVVMGGRLHGIEPHRIVLE
ncbi:MAG TPA: hypothetical protein VFO89_16970, partial [Thermoanaerobaculia bacterium]|nr:hypothetical protein [Thermoanaerobaculia bacterium]